MLTVNYYNDFFEIGQQKINFIFYELSLPDDDPVYTLKKIMEDLNFSGLLANCSDKVYKEFMLFAIEISLFSPDNHVIFLSFCSYAYRRFD